MFFIDCLKKKFYFLFDFYVMLKNFFFYYLFIVNYCWNCRGLKDL